MQLVTNENKISREELKHMAQKMFGDLVKAVVDIEKRIMIVDASMHVDEETVLLEEGSEQGNLWGINRRPFLAGTAGFIQFDSMINHRPSWGNSSRGVDDPRIRERIRALVEKLVTK